MTRYISFLIGFLACGVLSLLFTLRGLHFEINEHPCGCGALPKGCACKADAECKCKGDCCKKDGAKGCDCCQPFPHKPEPKQPEKKPEPKPAPPAPKEDAPDLGWDMQELSPCRAVLTYRDDAGVHVWTMARCDFDLVFGRVHLEPRTPEQQRAGKLATVELRK